MNIETKARIGMNLNIPVELGDGRWIMLKKGKAKTMTAIQIRPKEEEPHKPIEVGETVVTKPDAKDGKIIVLRVDKKRGRVLHMRIVGTARPT